MKPGLAAAKLGLQNHGWPLGLAVQVFQIDAGLDLR